MVLAGDVLTFTLWWIPLAVAFVVVIVAIGLLQNILATARSIDASVNDVWTVGKRIANTTIQLWLLGKTVGLVKDIRMATPAIEQAAQTIATHASGCRHCPACVSPDFHLAPRSAAMVPVIDSMARRATEPSPSAASSPPDTPAQTT